MQVKQDAGEFIVLNADVYDMSAFSTMNSPASCFTCMTHLI
jgi:hypothetical protein